MQLNPIAWVTAKLNASLDKQIEEEKGKQEAQTQAIVPAQPQEIATPEKEAEVVSGTFVPATEELYTESTRQTERFMKIVEQFDEDRQEPIEWFIRKGATLFCYIAPFILAGPIGWAVGDAFSANQQPSMVLAIHLLSVFLEIMMPVLGLASVIRFKRAVKDRNEMAGAVSVGVFFVAVSIGNALALLFLLEKGSGIDFMNNAAGSIGIIGRSFGSFIIDVGSSVYLSVSTVKSLQKYLADQKSKISAVREVNMVNIEMESAQIKAAIDRQTAIMDMQSKQSRANTWNEIEKLQSQAMIEQARRSMSGGGSGYRRSSW